MSKCDVGGIIQGVVSEDGVVKVNSPVCLYDRDSGKLLQRTRTAADGSFYFKDVDRESASYMVLATDEDGVAKKNALVFDRIQPVNDTAGAAGWDYNWPTLVRGKEVLVAATPRSPGALPVDIPTQVSAWNGSVSWLTTAYNTGVGSVVGADPNVFPGIPGCPSLLLRASRIRHSCVAGARQRGLPFFGPIIDNLGASGKVKPSFTFESAVLLSSSSLQSHEYNYGRAGCTNEGYSTSPTDVITTFAVQVVCGSSRYIRVVADVTTSGYTTQGVGINNSSWAAQVAQFDVTSLGTGWKHLAVTISYETGDVKLYCDGTLFGTVNSAALISSTPLDLAFYSSSNVDSYANYAVPTGLYVTGVVTPLANGYAPGTSNYLLGTSTTYVELGPFALYEVELSAEEIELHYRAMMTTTVPPLLSGYARKVADLRPMRYWRLDGEDGQRYLTEAFSRRICAGFLENLGEAKFVEGPMPGRKALKVSPNSLFSGENAGCPMNRVRSTVMCWVYKEAGKSVPIFYLYGGKKFGTSSFTGTDNTLQVNSAGSVSYGESLSGSLYTWTSATGIIPDGVWTHLTVSINTATLRCEYYVNGVLAAETVANSGTSSFRYSEPNNSRYVGKEDTISIGCYGSYRTPSSSTTIGGAVSDLAFFPLKLTAAQILEIYNSRLAS